MGVFKDHVSGPGHFDPTGRLLDGTRSLTLCLQAYGTYISHCLHRLLILPFYVFPVLLVSLLTALSPNLASLFADSAVSQSCLSLC